MMLVLIGFTAGVFLREIAKLFLRRRRDRDDAAELRKLVRMYSSEEY